MDLTPRWVRDLERLLPIRSQFVVSGNIRDSFLTPVRGADTLTLAPLLRCLWASLSALGYRFLLVYDPIEGLRPYPKEPACVELATRLFDLKLQNGVMPASLETLVDTMKAVTLQREARCALVIDFASRLTRQADHLDGTEHRFFLAAQRLSLVANPIVPRSPDASSAPMGLALFNPILWLVNRAQDLPSWLTLDSARIASLIISQPDYSTRHEAARFLATLFPGFDAASAPERDKFAQTFADLTDGLTLSALSDIAQLAERQGIGMAHVDDAVQCFKVGATDNPWKKSYLRAKIAGAQSFIENRVRGQERAITKTMDILMRSVMGLTGAQARGRGNRPRGVLFFAGPTGVGKTELAKTLTQLVFGDEHAYIRFDMSEFAEEHASARLLGAPPGYVGYDAGGELTNAVRAKPFSVVLFDEIEKAHPRILDKFLQILEDGRLTDGQGDTTYFSEAIIVFTSNLGIYVEDEHGRRVQNVQASDAPEVVEERVRQAIQDYFKFRLSRPEILNRLGDNIVVFGFISPQIGARIMDGMLANVITRVCEEHKIELLLPDTVRAQLQAACTKDLSNGGRGIGNRLESAFINPLSRALFLFPLEGRTQITVTSITEAAHGVTTVNLE
ncbi:MAG: ATP-dependent Clp protease ATP-binding subunit [Rhodoferax sp.]|nr:ATP-dependent Clp protease ATP-binding subunit [Rhodoferax sp.]